MFPEYIEWARKVDEALKLYHGLTIDKVCEAIEPNTHALWVAGRTPIEAAEAIAAQYFGGSDLI